MSSEFEKGIISVVQTPFTSHGQVDWTSLCRLVETSISAGVSGLLAPAVASEVSFLTNQERERIIQEIARESRSKTPFIAGISHEDSSLARHFYSCARDAGATGCLLAVPEFLYQKPVSETVDFVKSVCQQSCFPLILQDLDWNGPGLSLSSIKRLRNEIPGLVGIKIETVPAGPKYTTVRNALGEEFFICGGWAVPQMIEALDRQVDAMMPESSMIPVYKAIYRTYFEDRARAVALFQQLLPVLVFANQEIQLSIAFFKRLLVRKRIFSHERVRSNFRWDRFNARIADDLIEHYLGLEARVLREF